MDILLFLRDRAILCWAEYWGCSFHLYPELTLSQKIKAKLQNPDLLELCHLVPKEVVQLGEAWGGQDGRRPLP